MNLRLLSLLLVCALIGRAETAQKHLAAGEKIPDVTLRTEKDKEVRLRKIVAEKPTVLIFYRGGWCPFCNRHLQGLAKVQKELRDAGAQLLAISMDQPSKLRETPHRDKLDYQLLSDSDAVAAKAFGISFKVDDATVKKYKESFNIDLEGASGRTHHMLPHPAVFVADPSGVIRFAYVNEDYKVRLEPKKILEAVRGMKP